MKYAHLPTKYLGEMKLFLRAAISYTHMSEGPPENALNMVMERQDQQPPVVANKSPEIQTFENSECRSILGK